MLRWRTKGLVESLLLLPLLLILAWGSALLSFILIQKSRTEQAAWVYGTALSHKTDRQQARAESLKTSGAKATEFNISSERDCLKWIPPVLRSPNDLPLSFQGALGLSCPKLHVLRIEERLPDVVRDFLRIPTWIRSETETRTPGEDFRKSRFLRQALWQEAMFKAGFGALPLQLLGVRELAGLTHVDLGGPAEGILREYGGKTPADFRLPLETPP